jgi:1,2-diacylglycerol 3-beta-galactosyltransferase
LEILFHWLKDNRALLNYRAENARRLGRPQAAFQAADLAWAAAQSGPIDRTGRRILGRPKLLDLLKTHRVPWKDEEPVDYRTTPAEYPGKTPTVVDADPFENEPTIP